ncbi:MAG TPA: hypothetical protein VF734_16835 [Pseudonocardiaceae bacterium]
MHSDERRERIAAIGGLLFPLSIIMLIAWPPPENVQWPSPAPAPEELVTFYRESGGYLLITNAINVLGILLGIGFFWSLYRVLSRAQPPSRATSTTGYAAGLLGSAVAIASVVLLAVPAAIMMGTQAMRTAWDLSGLLDSLSLLIAVVAVGASSMAILRSGVLPRWLGYYGLAVTLALLVLEITQFASAAYLDGPRNIVFFAFLIWIGATSIVLVSMRRRSPTGTPSLR